MAQAGYTPISLYHSATPGAAPTAGNLVDGELALNTADGKLYYKDSGGVVQSISGATATYTRTSFTATAGQTTFNVIYTAGYVEVFLNGVLLNGTDYTATNGTTVVLATGAALNDIVEVIAYNLVAIGIASSSTNLAGGAASQIPYQSSTGTTAFIPNGTTGQALISNGTSAPGFGTLSVSGGGTGLTTLTAANNALYSTSSSALTAGTLPVAAGGTGATSLTANNVILGNGTSAVQFVAPGANGNILVSNGTTWTSAAPGSSGAMTLISTKTASSSSQVEWTGLSGYSTYILIIRNFLPSSFGADGKLEFGTGSGPTYLTSGYYGVGFSRNNGGQGGFGNVSDYVPLSPGISAGSNANGLNGTYTITNFNTSGSTTNVHGVSTNSTIDSNDISVGISSGTNNSTTAKTAIRISFSAGTIVSGTASLYGISS